MNRQQQSGALIRLRGLYPSLKAALQKVADVILRQPEMAIYASVNEVAAAAGVSEATVMRFCRILGFRGFQDFKIALAREMVAPARYPEELEGKDPATLVRKVFQSNIAALQDTLEVMSLDGMERAAQIFNEARQLMIVGVGGSGPIAQYAATRFFRLGLDAHCYSDSYLIMMASALLSPADAALVISHSGATAIPRQTAQLAKEAGVRVVCITNNSISPLARLSDIALVTASRGNRYGQETLPSRLCQVSIIDSLFTLLLHARPQKAEEIFNRIDKIMSSK